EAWAAASSGVDVAAFESFLKEWPQSQHADAARARIKELKGAPTRRWLLQGVGGAVGLAVVGGATWVELQPGFPLWQLLYDQSIRTFKGHSDAVDSVAFSPDGRTALSGSYDNPSSCGRWRPGRSSAPSRDIRALSNRLRSRPMAAPCCRAAMTTRSS